MGITNILLLVLGYVLLLFSTKLVNGGGISIMRKGPTSDAQERIFSWFALSLMPFLSIAISGGVLGLGNMVFTAALTAGVLQLLLIYGMLGITGTYRLAGNALRDLVLLLVCVVILIVCTNYTWSKGHPASTISRGMGLFLCVLAVAFTVWMLPYFMGKNRKLQRRPDTDFVPAIVFTLVGLALAGLGGVLLMNNTAALTHALNIEQGVLGVAVIGVGLVLPEYVRVARKYWMNTQKPVSMHLTLATGNLGLLLMIGLSAVISPIIITFAGAYLLLACVVAIIVFGILFYVGGEVGKIKAILFLAGFALVFVLLMKFSLH